LLVLAASALWQMRELSRQLARIVETHNARAELARRLHAALLRHCRSIVPIEIRDSTGKR
jgi:hypothetical protein